MNESKILLTIFSILLIIGFIKAQCPAPKTFTNPVIAGFFPDPSVVRVGDDYYCVNSTFEYFPGIVISHSKDLVNWQQIGHVFSKSEDLDLSYFFDGMGIWAPDISYYNGEFYIFYCMVQLSKDRSTNVRGNYRMNRRAFWGLGASRCKSLILAATLLILWTTMASITYCLLPESQPGTELKL